MHGPHHGSRVPHFPGHHRGHPRITLRLALQQPFVDEPGEGLPHRGPGQPKPFGQLTVPHHRSGFDLPGHDGVLDRFVRLLPEQGPAHGSNGIHN